MHVQLTKRRVRLSTFTDMCAAYARSQDRTLAYFRAMNTQARAFREGYAQSIQAPTEPYKTGEGWAEYVQLWRIDDGEFVDANSGFLFTTQDEDGLVWFGLTITVERARNTAPRRVYRERVGLRWLSNAIEVHLPEIDQVIVAPRDNESADYSDAFAAMTDAIMANLAVDPLAV